MNHGLAMEASPEENFLQAHQLHAHQASLWRDQLLHRLAGHGLPPSPLADPGGLTRFMPSVPPSSSPAKIPEDKPGPMADFFRLRQRVLRLTVSVTVVAGLVTALVWDPGTCLSLLAGASAGILYLLLLSRSVERLGKRSSKLGKTHLAAPILLVILALRLPGLDFLPAFLGFLLYKPAILLIAFRDLTGSDESRISVSGSPPA